MDFLFKRFNVLSLNVRGIRDLTKRKALFLFCKRSEADLILLQETHSCDSDTRFWKAQWGNVVHLFFNCPVTKKFWEDLGTHFLQSQNITHSFTLKDIICYFYFPQDGALEFVLNFIIIYAKFFIHKQKFNKSSLCFKHYILELNMLFKSHKLVKNKKNEKLLYKYYDLFPESS